MAKIIEDRFTVFGYDTIYRRASNIWIAADTVDGAKTTMEQRFPGTKICGIVEGWVPNFPDPDFKAPGE